MPIYNLIFKELLHRKINFFLGTLAIVTAVAFFVSFFTTSAASRRETIRLTRDMGFNLRIISKATNMDEFWSKGFSQHTLPETYIQRFAAHKDFSFAHLTATLHQPLTWRDLQIILTGISPEIEPSGKKKSSMSFSIQPGTLHIGYEIARNLDLQKGESVTLLGEKFTVANTLPETGSDEDIRLYGQLPDIQTILNRQGQINEIKALNCLCLINHDGDPLELLREQLEIVLPEAKVIMNKTIAIARERQRLMLEKYFAFIMPFVIIVCAAWISALTMLNVRERRTEIGILRALGYGAMNVTALFLGRAFLSGLLGAVFGFGLGTALALEFGPEIFRITAGQIQPGYNLLGWSLLAAPVFAALSSFIPAMLAITQDPALTLREE